MRLVSPLLKHVVYPGLAMSGYLRRNVGIGPAVVTYHGVLPAGYRSVDPLIDGSLVTPQVFRRQLGLLKARYNMIAPEEFLLWCEGKRELPPRSVLLTCDDGLRNNLTDMLPILQEAGFSCLFFVTGASLNETGTMLWYEELELMLLTAPQHFDFELEEVGINLRVAGLKTKRSLWWTLLRKFSSCNSNIRRALSEKVRRQLGLTQDWNANYLGESAHARRFLTLNVDELRRLAAAGMSIGAHTLSHPILSLVPNDRAWNEIRGSREELEQALGRPVWALAYPFGDRASVTRRELEMAERAGFKCGFVNVGGGFGAATPSFAIPRVHVTSEMDLSEFEAHVSGFYRALRRRMTGEKHGEDLWLRAG